MKSLITLVVFVFVLVFAAAPIAAAEKIPHVRALDARAGEALARGLERSARFRELAGELERSDVIVHIVVAVGLPGGIGGTTRIASRSGGYRYVRITLEAALAPDVRTAVLGHELQHACEIARSAAADVNEMRRLYRQIGRPVPGAGEAFDTPAAAAAGRRVWRELGAWPQFAQNDAVPAYAWGPGQAPPGGRNCSEFGELGPGPTTRDRAPCGARSAPPGRRSLRQ